MSHAIVPRRSILNEPVSLAQVAAAVVAGGRETPLAELFKIVDTHV